MVMVLILIIARILVIYEGEIVANMLNKDITINELGLYMAGSKRSA